MRCFYLSHYVKQILLSACTQQYLSDICLLLYVRSSTPEDGRKDRPKHVECYSKQNKFETLVHLFGFTIEIYYDARPYERQKYFVRTRNETDA